MRNRTGYRSTWVEPLLPDRLADAERRRIADLMPGGGFLFNTVHNIQGNAPPENIMAMWETLQEYGAYNK